MRGDQPVREQVQPQVGVVRVDRRIGQRADLGAHDQRAHPAGRVGAGQRGQLGGNVGGVVPERGRRVPGVEDGAVVGDGGQPGAGGGLGARCGGHGVRRYRAGRTRWCSDHRRCQARPMRVRCFDRSEVASFVAAAWPLLAADPVRHTDGLTVLDALFRHRTGSGGASEIATQLTVHDGGVVAGALVRTDGSAGAGVRGAPGARRTGRRGRWPPPTRLARGDRSGGGGRTVRGRARGADRRPGRGWTCECGCSSWPRWPRSTAWPARSGGPPPPTRTCWPSGCWPSGGKPPGGCATRNPPAGHVRRSLDAGDGMLLWEDAGRPVALAVARRPIAGMSRVGPVYTPPEHRRHGYGAAPTAAAATRGHRGPAPTGS